MMWMLKFLYYDVGWFFRHINICRSFCGMETIRLWSHHPESRPPRWFVVISCALFTMPNSICTLAPVVCPQIISPEKVKRKYWNLFRLFVYTKGDEWSQLDCLMPFYSSLLYFIFNMPLIVWIYIVSPT